MKFIHLSDLHIGKKLNGFSLLEDQQFILEQVLTIANEVCTDAILISGDIYDTAVPSAEAVQVLDNFLTKLAFMRFPVFIISGNHDSNTRLTFLSKILSDSNIYISSIFNGVPDKITLKDKFGNANIYLLPFIKPQHVLSVFNEFNGESYNDAVKYVIDKIDIDENERNIICIHQFVTANGLQPEVSDSEMVSVGGLDNVDFRIFDKFDYVALGHLHSPQIIGRETVVYSGSPLKYSISERHQNKSVTLVEMREKGNITVKRIPLAPLRDVRQIKGPLLELLKMDKSLDYISVILTDKTRHLEPYRRLRAVYENCVSVSYEGDIAFEGVNDALSAKSVRAKCCEEIFSEFYLEQNGEPLDDFSVNYIKKLFESEENE